MHALYIKRHLNSPGGGVNPNKKKKYGKFQIRVRMGRKKREERKNTNPKKLKEVPREKRCFYISTLKNYEYIFPFLLNATIILYKIFKTTRTRRREQNMILLYK